MMRSKDEVAVGAMFHHGLIRWAVPIAFAAVLFSPSAHADDKVVVLRRIALALELGRCGEHREAADQLERAYRSVPRARILYFIGREYQAVYETDGGQDDARRAVVYYRDYLHESPGAPDRGTVKKTIAAIEVESGFTTQVPAAPANPHPGQTGRLRDLKDPFDPGR